MNSLERCRYLATVPGSDLRLGVVDNRVEKVFQAERACTAHASEDFCIQETFRIRKLLLRAQFDGLALAIQVNVSRAADDLHERIDDARKGVGVNPRRFE